MMLIKTLEKMTAARRLKRFLEHCTLAEVNIKDGFTRLAKAETTVEMTIRSLM